MATNLELKVKCAGADLGSYVARAQASGIQMCDEQVQRDTYFRASRGRLKLREITRTGDNPDVYELIGYERPNIDGSRWSNYECIELGKSQAEQLQSVLEVAVGIHVIVTKHRLVGRWKRTRVHFDRVDDLGEFIEFETVTDSDEDPTASSELGDVVRLLAITELPVISGSYADLLARRDADAE